MNPHVRRLVRPFVCPYFLKRVGSDTSMLLWEYLLCLIQLKCVWSRCVQGGGMGEERPQAEGQGLHWPRRRIRATPSTGTKCSIILGPIRLKCIEFKESRHDLIVKTFISTRFLYIPKYFYQNTYISSSRVSDPVWYWPTGSRKIPDPATSHENFPYILWFLITICYLGHNFKIIKMDNFLHTFVPRILIRVPKPDPDQEKFENLIRIQAETPVPTDRIRNPAYYLYFVL